MTTPVTPDPKELVKILKELQLDTMAVHTDIGDYDSPVEYLTAKLHWAEVQTERLFTQAQQKLLSDLVEQLPEKKVLEIEEPSLYQGVGGDSAPFYCSGCQMSEMNLMDRQEGDKYYCNCSYWTDPHNAFLDKSGGKWLGWKDKSKAQEYLDNLPIEENGYNQALTEVTTLINKYREELE